MMNPEEFENRSRLRRVGLYLFMLVSLGVSLAVMAYVSHMQLLGWSLQDVSASSGRMLPVRAQLVLYRSEPTARFMASVGGNAETLLRPWRDYAKENSFALTERTSLDGLSPSAGDVLVLPSVVALGDKERDAVLRYRAQGGNVMTTWATGSRDADGRWVGWSFLHALAKVTVVGELPGSDGNSAMVTRGQTPLTHGLQAGAHIRLGKVSEHPLVLGGSNIAAQASTELALKSTAGTGLLAFDEFGREDGLKPSRVVVLGIPETTWEYQRQDMHALVTGILGWLTSQPVVVPGDWPSGRRAAVMVALDVQENLAAAVSLMGQFKAVAQPVSVYVSSDQVMVEQGVLRSLRNLADLGYKGDLAQGFNGQSIDGQSQRLRRMVGDMSAVLGEPDALAGFCPPAEAFDTTTDQLLYELGIRYRLGALGVAPVSMPFYQGIPGEKPGQRFVVLPRPATNLGSSLSYMARLGVDQLRETLTSITRSARLNGTLGILTVSVSSADLNLNGAEGQKDPASALVDSSKDEASSVWRATGADIASWWSEKERFRIRVRPATSRLDLDVSIVGKGDFSGGSLVVMLPRKGVLPTIRGLTTGTPIPTVTLLDEFRALIRFNTLSVGNYGYQLTF